MKVLKQHKDSVLLNIVECPECSKKEYYGNIYMKNGNNYCRSCIYKIWQKETSGTAVEWKPSKNDETFPKINGENYYKNHKDEYLNN